LLVKRIELKLLNFY